MFLYAETPVHAGSGMSTGVIDLPIQREVYTELPIIQPQGIKGALREMFTKKFQSNTTEKNKMEQVFGPEGTDFSGAIGFTHARTLLFPVASLKGIFAYATSPYVLSLFKKDLERANIKDKRLDYIPPITDEKTVYVTKNSKVVSNSKVIFSQFAFSSTENDEVNNIAEFLSEKAIPDALAEWKERVKTNLVLLHDDIFKELTKIKTEVIYRNRIDPDKGIVAKGQLWSEEHLPSDTLLWCNIFAMNPLNKFTGGLEKDEEVVDYLEKQELKQFFVGGDQTVGRGLVSVKFLK